MTLLAAFFMTMLPSAMPSLSASSFFTSTSGVERYGSDPSRENSSSISKRGESENLSSL